MMRMAKLLAALACVAALRPLRSPHRRARSVCLSAHGEVELFVRNLNFKTTSHEIRDAH